MAFSVNALTSDGNALLAQATSSNPIVYIGAVASEYDFSAAEIADMGSIQDQGWTITDGVVVAASATDITARIIIGFYNRQQSVECKTFGVVGRLQSQSDAQAVVVAAVSDPSASIRLPGSDEASVRVEIAINMAISDQLTVSVTSSTAGSAMLSDLDRLVSCHKVGQPYSGEAQTIYGGKRFMSDIRAPDIHLNFIETDEDAIVWIGYNSSIRILQDGQHDEALHLDSPQVVTSAIEVQEFYCNIVTSDLVPEGGGLSVGRSGDRWDTIYSDNIDASHYTGGQVDGDVEISDTLITHGMVDLRGGYTLDNAVPLNMVKCPIIPGTNTIQIGGIFLAVVVSTSGSGTVTSGQTIPSTINIFKAESYSQSTGGLITPKFGSGVQIANDGSSYVAINSFTLSGSSQQALAFCIRIK